MLVASAIGLSLVTFTLPVGCADSPPAPSGAKLVRATVVRVVDGDTARMVVSGGTEERVRFIGVDTPESTNEHEPYGAESSAYTKRVIGGRRVWLEVGTDPRDRYGRLLAYVWLQPPQTGSESEIRLKLLNARLLLDGYARQLTVPPNVEYAEEFRRFAAEARDNGVGLWSLE